MANPHDLDKLHKTLDATLGRIEQDVGQILDGTIEIFDPGAVVVDLESQTRGLCEVMAGIEGASARAAEAAANGQADLEHLTETVIARAVEDATFPVVVKAHLDRSIPPLAIPAGGLHAILRIVTRRGIEFAGPGGEMVVATERRGDRASFSIASRREHDQPDRGVEEFKRRFEPVRELIEDLGGGLRIEVDPKSLRVELALRVRIEIS